ncbi:carbohydrate kinase [Schaalia sp. 19OD2882]|uniref:carbohydrate kinase family protein n=1 Tax=Schaalia sp. 19OD2882 TaxID=2794089 RepID=UPI001C1F0E4F|nr:carbohydrate kinase [Schaalia sp. 19OD2882]QWW20202.1 carbohydrate kinase [Schaalia sp. 19OD2882]
MDLATTPHVLAIGETLMDIVQPFGASEPAAEYPGGSPANVAMTLGRLGRTVVLQTWIGDDLRGHAIDAHFSASRVHITAESHGAHHTSTALASLDQRGAATYTFDFDWSPTAPIAVGEAARIVHAGSISATTTPGCDAVLDALQRARAHALVTYDPNARPSLMGTPEQALAKVERCVAQADVVKVSDEDIEWLTGGRDMDEVVAAWLELGPKLIVVTRGKKGALAVSASGVRLESVPGDVVVVDTVGAGDSFMGGILDALWELGLLGAEGRERLASISRDEVAAILARADRVADVTVSRSGANPPWADELEG